MKQISKTLMCVTAAALAAAITAAPINAAAAWTKDSAGWSWTENGVRKTGWLMDGSKWYYLDSNGIMKTGWQYADGNWYYLNSDGSMKIGWLQSDENWYYFDENGAMKTGTQLIDGVSYVFDSNGAWVDQAGAASMELKKIGNLQYYLYSPGGPTEDMPLVIYLHGGTNKKGDVASLLTTDGFPKYLYEGYYEDLRAYVAIPKLENHYKGWTDISDQIVDLIEDIQANYGISRNKVALTGHSMGGTGTYQLQVKLPDTFACIAPMSGSIQNNRENIAALSKTKIWAFVGTNDTIVKPDSSRAVIKVLREKGADAKISELEGAAHFDVPSLAYKNEELIQWLTDGGK